jgi:DNA-binding winged helix-turn-helix (wHTH) protein/tetratricopeptide (TPR) repeat protein
MPSSLAHGRSWRTQAVRERTTYHAARVGVGRDGPVLLILRLGGRCVELDGEALHAGGAALPLGPTPARLLAYLASNRDRVVPVDELLREVWNGVRVTPSSVQQAVHALRGAFAQDEHGKELIRTVRGRGYQLGSLVEVIEPEGWADELMFVGRDEELRRLMDAIEDARAGRGRLLLVAGPPGIGKTRLLQELEARSSRRGFLFLCGRCPEQSGAAALWPWEEILRGVLEAAPEALGSLAASDLATLRGAFPVLGAGGEVAPATLDLGAARFRLYEAVRRVLVAGARTRPLVVAIDDLHRADETSLRLLEWIAARHAVDRIVFVAAYRDLPAERDPALRSAVATLLRLPGSSQESLTLLGREEVERAARSALGSAFSEGAAEYLWQRSAGNPFFLRILVRQLRRAGERTGTAEDRLAPEAGEAVRQQLDVVTPETKALLLHAAIFGREFEPRRLAVLAGAPLADVSTALEQASAAGLVERLPRGSVRFVHALVAESLCEALDPGAGAALHARALEILEGDAPGQDPFSLGILAEHAWQAVLCIGPARAAAHCERAAESAFRRYAFEEAARLYDRALELSRDADPQRVLTLTLALGESRARAGQAEAARVALDRAIELAVEVGDDTRHARAVLALAQMHEDEIETVAASWIATLERATEAHRAETALRARLLSRMAAALWLLPFAPGDRGRTLARESVRLARGSGDADTLTEVLTRAYRILQTGPGDDAMRRETCQELAAAVERTPDPVIALNGRLFGLLWEALQVGDRHGFENQVAQIVRGAETVGAPHADWYALVARASRAHLMGQLERAEQLADQGLALGESIGIRIARQNHTLQLLSIRRDQGRLGDLEPVLAPVAENPRYPPAWRAAASLAALTSGRRAPARALLGELCADPDRWPRDCTYAGTIDILADLAYRLGDRDAAAVLAPYVAQLRGRHHAVVLGFCHWGALDRLLGCLHALLGRWDEAEAELAAGLASDRRFGAVAAVARGQRDLGELLLRRGRSADRPRARAVLEEAYSLAQGIGLEEVEKSSAQWLLRS